MCESDGKADLLSDHFDSKQSREAVDLALTYHPSSSLTTFAFWAFGGGWMILIFRLFKSILFFVN